MPTIELNRDNFHAKTASENILVDFYAPWCGPCATLSKVLEQLSDEGVLIGKVDIDSQVELAINNKVKSVPTLMWYSGGRLVATSLGVKSKKAIIDMISD